MDNINNIILVFALFAKARIRLEGRITKKVKSSFRFKWFDEVAKAIQNYPHETTMLLRKKRGRHLHPKVWIGDEIMILSFDHIWIDAHPVSL